MLLYSLGQPSHCVSHASPLSGHLGSNKLNKAAQRVKYNALVELYSERSIWQQEAQDNAIIISAIFEWCETIPQ